MEQWIAADDFCNHHQVEMTFITSLHQAGLINARREADTIYIDIDEMHQLEKYCNLYYELDINLEGIETIHYLLQRMNEMQSAIVNMRNQLANYR